MRLTDMRRREIRQFYLLPTLIIARNRVKTMNFIVWLYWCIQV